jgi:hypothetical protein
LAPFDALQHLVPPALPPPPFKELLTKERTLSELVSSTQQQEPEEGGVHYLEGCSIGAVMSQQHLLPRFLMPGYGAMYCSG